jgi:poly(hydroxyalkanoate) depolymerase family esterase
LHPRTLPEGTGVDSRSRTYQVYVPDGLPADGSAPLVTVLHGCRQTEADMVADTRFTELADANGFVVAFPFVTSWDSDPMQLRIENCWGFWMPEERTEGSGEVADVRRIIAAVESEFGTDPTRRYVAGLSSGAAMSVDLAVAYSEDIAAAGAVAGLPYAEAASAVTFFCGQAPDPNDTEDAVAAMGTEQADPVERRLVPLMVIQSIGDCTVSIVNGRQLRDSWIDYYDADPQPAATEDCMADGVSCTLSRFVDGTGATVVATVFYSGVASGRTHYWPGDNEGEFADPDGPSASEHLWAFFADKDLGAAPAVTLIAAATVTGDTVALAGTARAEAGVTGLTVALDGLRPQPETAATLAADGSWTAEFRAVPAHAFYAPVMRATLADGRTVSRTGVRFAVGHPAEIGEEVGTWMQHQAEARIGLPGESCVNRLWGVCDRDFTALFFEHQFAPFPLYRRAGASEWFADPENAAGG